MGTVYRKQTTRPLPVGADIFAKGGQRFARWKAGMRTRKAKLTTGRDGSERIITESPIDSPETQGTPQKTALSRSSGDYARRESNPPTFGSEDWI